MTEPTIRRPAQVTAEAKQQLATARRAFDSYEPCRSPRGVITVGSRRYLRELDAAVRDAEAAVERALFQQFVK